MGSWAGVSADPELGYVYIPFTAPGNSNFGGDRPGDNLYANSLVCVEAKTGKLVWYHQLVHHDLWDYDLAAAPVLGDINVNGKRIKAVMQTVKNGFMFVFDRVSGEPAWPIEERPVPASTVPGEHASLTQPFPTKPPAFDVQGIAENDLIDFTPQLRAEALEIVKHYRYGPLFTPPSLRTDEYRGTISQPSEVGSLNWNGPAFDPETGMIYVVSETTPWLADLIPTQHADEHTMAFRRAFPKGGEETEGGEESGRRTDFTTWEVNGPHGLPLTKPPYGRITAVDLNRGEKVWMVANGDGPRNHPLLKDLHLPPLGNRGRAIPLLTKTLLFLGEGSDAMCCNPTFGGGNAFRAYDKSTGQVIWQTTLPAGTTGAPMTYRFHGKQYIVVPIADDQHPPEWVALSLP
jgi:quinoprotein glucose dehydrogenase